MDISNKVSIIDRNLPITDMIIQYQHGAEWMMGQTPRIIETYDDEGSLWVVAQMIICGAPQLYRFPIWVFDLSEVPDEPEPEPQLETLPESNPKPPPPPKTTKTITKSKRSIRKAREKSETQSQCKATTKSGKQCKGKVVNDSRYCMSHKKVGE